MDINTASTASGAVTARKGRRPGHHLRVVHPQVASATMPKGGGGVRRVVAGYRENAINHLNELANFFASEGGRDFNDASDDELQAWALNTDATGAAIRRYLRAAEAGGGGR